MRKSTWQARYPEGQRKKPKTLSRTWVFTKSLLEKKHRLFRYARLHNSGFWLHTSRMAWSQTTALTGWLRKILVPRTHLPLASMELQTQFTRWYYHGATVSSCKATSKIKNVNPHGRGQVDGEDEGSKGAGKVHLKTVSWVVAWNIILSFFCVCCDYLIPSCLQHPAIPPCLTLFMALKNSHPTRPIYLLKTS